MYVCEIFTYEQLFYAVLLHWITVSAGSGEEVALCGRLVASGDFVVDLARVSITEDLVSEEIREAGVRELLQLNRGIDEIDNTEHGAYNILGTLLTLSR